jgi:hypothetical protein
VQQDAITPSFFVKSPTGSGKGRVVALLLTLLALYPAPAGAWETVFEGGGVLVQQRPYAGSALMEMRGEVRVPASLNALMALLKDADFNRHWVYRSGGARILQESGYQQAYVHGVVDAPFPMRDRDTVVRFDYVQDPQTREITITITNFPDFVPEEPGLVRVPDFGGFWYLRPLGDGRVEVTYQVHGDPGGWIPVWIANYAAAVSVTRTLQNLPEAVRRYSDARDDSVRELAADSCASCVILVTVQQGNE